MTNEQIADQLRHHAAELARAGNNLYRVRAFRRAAMAVLGLKRPAADLGLAGLAAVPGIGRSLAGTIDQFACRGEWLPRTQLRTAENF